MPWEMRWTTAIFVGNFDLFYFVNVFLNSFVSLVLCVLYLNSAQKCIAGRMLTAAVGELSEPTSRPCPCCPLTWFPLFDSLFSSVSLFICRWIYVTYPSVSHWSNWCLTKLPSYYKKNFLLVANARKGINSHFLSKVHQFFKLKSPGSC